MRYNLHEPIDSRRISDTTRFVIVRVTERDSDSPTEVFVANFEDISYIKSARMEAKDLRHRVAGITGSIGSDEDAMPDSMATVEFI